ncbi:alpha/beta hydrolase [Oryzifoliimicrobium ureilyticus]|uniref:alpha/beta hydrolase n=1 Tax=Oryzifoliimicrobium ureilyticus TaxID=3113724 RepID=UPI0030764B99
MQAEDLSFFQEGSNGKGVLLVHGLTGAPAEMRLMARQLHKRGYSVYAPLLAGHGKGEAVLRRSHWQDWLETVETAGHWLSERTDRVYSAGICVGGKLALLAADRNKSKIGAVALYSPCFRYDGWNVPKSYIWMSSHIRFLAMIPFLDRLNFKETPSLGIKDERIRRRVAQMTNDGMLEHFPGRGLVEMSKLGEHLKKQLPQISTPTLIVHSQDDDLSSPEHARYIASHLGGPAKLHWLNDSYHMIHVDRQHSEVATMSAEFFEADYAECA